MANAQGERSAYRATGYQMIRSVDIQNFKCFKHLKLNDVRRLNVIVGDNGSGKTALLESIFFPLGTTTGLAARYRQQRGLDGHFTGSRIQIEDALFGELFHKFDYQTPVRLIVKGDGPETRSLTISRGRLDEHTQGGTVTLIYEDSEGNKRTFYPDVLKTSPLAGIDFPDTGEDMPNFFYFAATRTPGSIETAGRFSDLSRARRQQQFVEVFAKEYRWLQDINIELIAGAAALYGTLDSIDDKIALPNISGGINRITAILLTIASRPQSIVLVDEIENGIYYKHQTAIWTGLLKFLRQHDGQMLATTHSKEWLDALVEAAGKQIDDVAVWRVEGGPDGREILQFSGDTLKAGVEHGVEVRSSDGPDD